MNDNLNTIVEGRVFEGKLFATNRDRGLYIGTLIRNRPQWLKENAGRWRYIKDIQGEAASLASAGTEVNVVAAASGPNGQTSSHDIRKDGGEKSDVISVDIPADDSSPSCQPESVSPDDVPSESIQTELPPVEAGRKQGRVGRQRKKRTLSAKDLKARRKSMLVVLKSLADCAILSHAASKAGIHRKKLEYWIKRSKAGDDGYDFEEDGLIWRFHDLVEFAIDEAHDKILEVVWKIAMGELYKKEDGREVPHLYVRRPNGKMMRFLLERKFPEKYGKHPKVDVPQQGGVVLIGAPMKPKKTCAAASIKARQWKALSRRLRETKD
jgi:hypothetical protein